MLLLVAILVIIISILFYIYNDNTPLIQEGYSNGDVSNGYRYEGCWTNSSNTNLTLGATGSNMSACIDLSKSTKNNTAILKGTNCYVGTQSANPPYTTYFGLSSLIDPSIANLYCSSTGTTGSNNINASLVFSNFLAQTPLSVYDYSYKGCWNGIVPSSSGQIGTTGTAGTTGTTGRTGTTVLPYFLGSGYDISGCVARGSGLHYKTVGLMNGSDCYGGNYKATYSVDNYKIGGPVDTTLNPYGCDINNPGPTSMMIYSSLNEQVTTNITPYRYGGCWVDNDKDPYLKTRLGGTGMTLNDCILLGTTGYNSIAYKKGGVCYGGNQGTTGTNYKQGGEIPNNDVRCDVGGPGPDTSIIYTNYGPPQDAVISGYDYKGCWKDGSPSFTSDLLGYGYTLDKCITDSKKLGYDLVSFQNQNQCKGGNQNAGSDYTTYGKISDNNSPSCNEYYPGTNVGVVYSTSTKIDDDTTSDLIDKIKEKVVGGGGNYPPPSTIGQYLFKGYWNESPDRTVQNYLGSYTLEACVTKANTDGYNTVSFQNGNQCWAGTSSNYKKYGKPTSESIKDPSNTIAAIYSKTSEPSPHDDCGAHIEGLETMTDEQPTGISQPPYNIPQTTTIVFDQIPNKNTVITYSQTPISTSIANTSLSSSSAAAYGATTTTNGPTNLQNTSGMSQTDKSKIHQKWLPNTPYIYENKNEDSSSAKSPSPNTSSSTTSTNNKFPGSMFTNTDIINNNYGSATESFTIINQKDGKYKREGIESLTPPSKETPGPFVPKTMVVPPVCPSIPPVVIKTDCSVCKTNGGTQGGGGSSGTSSSSGLNNQNALTSQMTNNFTNTNSINGTQNMYGISCNNQGRSYDNIPQPYLPSFSGFGM